MAEVLVIGKKISEMGLVNEITGEEKIPTGVVGDKAVTTGQLLTYLENNGKVQWGRIEGDITNQADLQNQFTQERDTLKSYTQVVLQEHIDATNEVFKYARDNGSALPYKEGISYEEGAVVVKDGELQQWKGGVWRSAVAEGLSDAIQTFNTPEAGVDPVTGVVDGAYFNVRSTDDDSFLVEYQNIGGVPTLTGKSLPSASFINDRFSDIDADLDLTKVGMANMWTAGKSYTVGDTVKLNDGTEVVSIVDSNTTDPNSDLTGWKRKNAKFTFFDFGFKHNTDCTVQLKNLANYAADNDLVIEDFSNETYFYSENISIVAPNRSLTIESNCKFESDTNGITMSGSLTEIGQLSANTLKSTSSITLSSLAVQVSVGDILVIHNTKDFSFAAHRAYYRDGEYNFVKAVSGNTITLKQQTQSEYLSSDIIKVYKLDPIKLKINGLTVNSSAVVTFSARLFYKSDFDFNVLNEGANPSARTALMLDRGLRSDITGGNYEKLVLSGTGTDYGVVISNCQDIKNKADYCYGARHGVAVGGGEASGTVPNRRVNTIGATIENDPTSNLQAADFHGNVSDSYYEDCDILGRITLSGFNVSSRSNKLQVATGDVRIPIGLGEVVGGTIESVGDVVVSSGAAITIFGWLTSVNTEKVTRPTTLKLTDVKFTSNTDLTGIATITNLPVASSFVMDGFELNGADTLTRLMTYVAGATSTKPNYVQVTNPRYLVSESTPIISGEAGLTGVKKNVFQTSGSNANGSWTKFSDGTMICSYTIATTLPITEAVAGGFKSANIGWTYPVEFIYRPKVTAMSYDNSSMAIRATSVGTSSAQLYSVSPASIPSAGVTFDIIAVGRWLRE